MAGKTIGLSNVAVAAGALGLGALAVALWSLKRRPDARSEVGPEVSFDELLPSLVGATHASLIDGNEVVLLENGRFFDALFDAIRGAERSVTFETFLWKPGRLSRDLVTLLAAKGREGVAVRVLVDGTRRKLARDEEAELRAAGCRVARYHPFNFLTLGTFNNRDHRKICVVDGKTGFVGGHCIADDWLGDAREGEVRDISARLRGPAVAALQSAFLENWIESTGDVPVGEAFFPSLERVGSSRAHVVYVSPSGLPSSVELLHAVAIAAAKKRIVIQNPYFVPDPEAVRALVAAVRRGVDVQVMVPSAAASDSPAVQHASHHRFGALLAGGVRIFEYHRSLLHQKVMTIDGCWSSIGSTNFDDRSFELNDEVTLGVRDEAIARQLEEIFRRDLAFCTESSAAEWKERRWGHKLRDAAAFAVNEQL
ncbi:MAG TPA: phospholipase D-like domain-containing protein [Thermoanaerobaculia bacterium]|nr:phospholipase D-like domain-containing protein [Thermoanaerobaculia bacterium]